VIIKDAPTLVLDKEYLPMLTAYPISVFLAIIRSLVYLITLPMTATG